MLAFRQHRPDAPRHLVGERDGHEDARFSQHELPKPGVLGNAAPTGTHNRGHGADNQKSSDVVLTGLRYPA